MRVLLLCILLQISNQGRAAIIDYGDWTTDTDSGLDWLDMRLTTDRAFEYVSSQFGSGGAFEGWRYASRYEFNDLVSNVVEREITSLQAVTHFPGALSNLVGYLGVTYDNGSGVIDGIISDQYFYEDVHRVARLRSSRGFDESVAFLSYQVDQRGHPTIGSYLVRATTVPEPTAFLLLASGLIGLYLTRKYPALTNWPKS